ncbi:mannose-6-phosphate isomerase [Ancylomarina euxinus]|uniref:Phosphohexomutase n=1 Tax=Ancylomarina euxinus TaxID=2283627 RepID=A0A425XWC2_9BACT|nr:type I phosphomannose isomerase catalytic subunit [Ancylomarina euxinus]MCZ4696481.1 class I mannose-6-phosphate isomerase [Ancylomarina euxinus]MUP16849.1 mannose-6-phosphate isomerase [Ancylomarina euxinus]RRG18939.1 mannose-6-phosphate isomerase [Ancylomarina euxinus]
MSLYPLKFTPIAKETIWGGNKLQQELNKDFATDKKIGESWEISGVPNDISIVSNGDLKGKNLSELIQVYAGQLLGEKNAQKFGSEFPLLIKFIDANDVLSIQVHPDDNLAKERHNSFGKTEMWYVLGAEKESNLIVGFNQKVDQNLYQEKLKKGKLEEILNVEKVQKGSTYFIPAGRVHAIGKGILVAEIQQTSDITYRMYDWNRTDAQGNGRELHTELALDAIDYSLEKEYETTYTDLLNHSSELATCEYFTTYKLIFDQEIKKDYSKLDSFVIYMCLDGEFELEYSTGNIILEKGETILIPAELKSLVLKPKGTVELLEVYI